MINGGGSPFINYQSHMLHVQDLLEILRSSGVAADEITIFSSDGNDPGADLAARQPAETEELWRIKGTGLEQILRPVTYESSALDGMDLQPASRGALQAWFAGSGAVLDDGDTLLLYVTDHGEKNDKDPSNNTITLWGGESLSVTDLRAMLDTLDPDVRVVMLMSQCFSGAFANLMSKDDALPEGNVCGYFSSTAMRPAYGCYAENLGRKNVGHSFHFMQALVETGRFDRAHDKVLYTDATPDVPLRTSSVFARERLNAAAKRAGENGRAFADEILATAWTDRGAWETEIRQLDRIGHAFGYFSPRSLAELDEQAKQLPEISKHLRSVAGAWQATRGDANAAAITRLLEDDPTWKERLSPQTLGELDRAEIPELTAALLAALEERAAGHLRQDERLQTIHERAEKAGAAAYRMEVRLAAVLRLRNLLRSVAARAYLASSGTEDERRAFASLRACEELALPIGNPDRVELVPAQAFPPFEEDITAATAAVPAWIGIRFRATQPETIKQLGLQPGAADVLGIFPDSPAEAAGLELGDIILGPPGTLFTEPNQVRSWTMLSKAGEPRVLEVLRTGKRRRVTLTPAPYPMTFPELPGPPKVGSAAPPVNLVSYRGKLPKIGDGKPQLLVFWATWCAPCKAALPELKAYAEATGTEIVGITDETPKALDRFFEGGQEYTVDIAVDEYRRTYLAYGVSGTPTFVLVDGSGKIVSYSTGYSPEKSLGIPDWTWTRAKK